MIKDITIGQFYPADSILHKLDPRVKLMGTFIFIISVFLVDNLYSFAFITACLICLILLSHVPFLFMVRGLRMIMVLLIIAGLINLFMTPGTPLWSYGIFSITPQGIKRALMMVMRMVYLIIGASLMTLTTTPGNLTDGLEKSLRFLTVFHVPVHEMALMMSIALRFIPILMEETDKIMKAQMARGADFEQGNLIKRSKNLVPILVPLFVSAFRRANDLALAMEARCYHGSNTRTRMYPLCYSRRDILSYFVIGLVLTITLILRILF